MRPTFLLCCARAASVSFAFSLAACGGAGAMEESPETIGTTSARVFSTDVSLTLSKLTFEIGESIHFETKHPKHCHSANLTIMEPSGRGAEFTPVTSLPVTTTTTKWSSATASGPFKALLACTNHQGVVQESAPIEFTVSTRDGHASVQIEALPTARAKQKTKAITFASGPASFSGTCGFSLSKQTKEWFVAGADGKVTTQGDGDTFSQTLAPGAYRVVLVCWSKGMTNSFNSLPFTVGETAKIDDARAILLPRIFGRAMRDDTDARSTMGTPIPGRTGDDGSMHDGNDPPMLAGSDDQRHQMRHFHALGHHQDGEAAEAHTVHQEGEGHTDHHGHRISHMVGQKIIETMSDPEFQRELHAAFDRVLQHTEVGTLLHRGIDSVMADPLFQAALSRTVLSALNDEVLQKAGKDMAAHLIAAMTSQENLDKALDTFVAAIGSQTTTRVIVTVASRIETDQELRHAVTRIIHAVYQSHKEHERAERSESCFGRLFPCWK